MLRLFPKTRVCRDIETSCVLSGEKFKIGLARFDIELNDFISMFGKVNLPLSCLFWYFNKGFHNEEGIKDVHLARIE